MASTNLHDIDYRDLKDPVRNVYVDPERRALIRTEDVYQMDIEVGTVGYSDTLLSVIANYRNSGRPAGYNAQCMVGKAKKGEVALKLFAVVDPDAHAFVKVGFQSRGCLAVTACASVACTMIEGRTFKEALEVTADDIRRAVDGVPADKSYTPYFAVEGIRALVGDYWLRNGMTLDEFNARGLCDDQCLGCLLCENCSLRSFRIERLVDATYMPAYEAANRESAVVAAPAPAEQALAASEDAAPLSAAADAQGGSDRSIEEGEDAGVAPAPAVVGVAAPLAGSFAEVADDALGIGADAGADAQRVARADLEMRADAGALVSATAGAVAAPQTPEQRDVLERNALARVFDDVRTQSAAGLLVIPPRWNELGLVPEHLDADRFEMMVYEYVREHGCEERRPAADEASGGEAAGEGVAASARFARRSRFRTATKPVGVPRFFDPVRLAEDDVPHPGEDGDSDATRSADVAATSSEAAVAAGGSTRAAVVGADADDGVSSGGTGGAAARPDAALPTAGTSAGAAAAAYNASVHDQVFGSLSLPEGYKLVERDGSYVLVPLEAQDAYAPLMVECSTIAVIEGEYEYYLYDTEAMTSSFAHWSFLAAEGNDAATLVDCVREESRLYPRPMPASGFSNRPFHKTPDEVERIFAEVRESGNYPDIERTVASNGDVYFYSTRYLDPDYAASLAEWRAVGRKMSV
ncbi:iron-sulfur cluster assembly scaffold protein [Berryella wangjianweii]|uniref:iron-sulfur cluster assembly scaffold protein n=1 Tax=Berryella wangjianweii TaxID=2734634 RepID=UPI0021BD6F28|nr:iron-sulfur cluster assembly scaffold protein [Berryella wangjianweii]